MLKKISFCFVSLILMLLCLFVPISSIIYADTNFTPTYTFNGSNLGFVSAGIGQSTLANFSNLTYYNVSYDGFNTRLGFSTTTTEFGLGSSNPINFNLVYNCSNRNEYFKPIPVIYNVDSNLNVTTPISSTLDSNTLSYSYSFTILDSLDDRYFNIDNRYTTGSIFCSGFVPSQMINYNGTPTSYYTYNYFAFKLGDMSVYGDDGVYAHNGKVFANSFRSINVVSIELGSSKNWSYGSTFDTSLAVTSSITYSSDLSNSNVRFNYVIYNFDNGIQFLYVFGCQYYNANNPPQRDTFYWDYRRYYITTDMVDNVYYNNGFNDGYDSGYTQGNLDGYYLGFTNGQQYGEGIGYAQGVDDAGEYTFFSLISAVIDAPINAFKSLFNFNFLGVNLLDFVTGLITLAFAIWIIRLVL